MSSTFLDRRFAPGDWYAVSGDNVLVVLPPSARSRVAALWDLADAGEPTERLLDAVLAEGVSTLSDLLLLSETADGVRVLVRGSVVVTLRSRQGETRLAADPALLWTEQVVASVTGVRVDLTGGTEATAPLPSGIARVGSIELGDLETLSAAAPEPTYRPEATPEPSVNTVVETDVEAEAEAEAAPVAAPVEAPPEDWTDRDGQTQAAPQPSEFVRPPIPGQEQAPSVVSRPVAKLVFSTGEVVDVDRAVLAGRAPEAKRFASHDQPRLITLASPNQEISSTHLEIRPGAGVDHGMAIVTDLGSTNGTVLVQPGLPPEDLQPGIAVSLLPGAVLDLGDGVTIQVTNP